MKLILSSSDFRNPESAKFIYDHLDKPISDCRVLYFPNEKATEESIKSGKFECRLMEFGFVKKNIFVFNYYNPAPFFDLDIDVVYISGGNTFGTLKRIRETGSDRAIINYVHRGAIYIGGSAGAHIAGSNLSHVAQYDTDTYGISDFSGLGLYDGILICHYDNDRKADLERLKSIGKNAVKVLRNHESILIQDE